MTVPESNGTALRRALPGSFDRIARSTSSDSPSSTPNIKNPPPSTPSAVAVRLNFMNVK